MFSIFRMLGSGVSLNILKLVGVGVLGLCLFFAYNYVSNKFEQLDKANIQIAQQTKAIEDLTDSLIKLKQSNEITLASLKALQETKVIIKEKSVKKVVAIASRIKVIEADKQVSDQIKEQQKSKVYIEDIFNTICEINKEPCTEEIK